MTQRRPHVTDHALICYLERVIGVDVDAHRREIEQRVTVAVERGACALVREGFRYRIRDCNVTTIVAVGHDPQFPDLRFTEEDE